jgi:uncharacterized protein (TIGR03000 family)
MLKLITHVRLASLALAVIFPALAAAQFHGRAGPPPGPPPIRGMGPPPVIMPAPVARQSALPLAAPPVSPILNRPFPGWNSFGGFSYYPYYGYSQPNIIVQQNYTFQAPYFPPRPFADYPPLPSTHPNSARLTLAVPLGADVFIGGKKMEMAGTERTFESPDLGPGESFTFDVRVVWKESGKDVEQKRTLTAKAGEHPSLQYIASAPAQAPVRLDK